jgi:threonine dehydratase
MHRNAIGREQITATERLIRPHIRRTPVIEVDGADFGLHSISLVLKLESLQHGGSFKARGAFTNLLTREVPAAGVVAASGGNHGVAVAFAAMKLGKPATIFVPGIASHR